MTSFHETERHLPTADYTRPRLEIDAERRRALVGPLEALYGRKLAEASWPELERLLRVHHACTKPAAIAADREVRPEDRFSERDVVLITYADFIRSQGKTPLRALRDFLDVYMKGAIHCVHILPFYPSSSDRGFSVMDYEEVDPRLGTWEDVRELTRRFRLMVDAVVNHMSSKSGWFEACRAGDPEFRDFFLGHDSPDAIPPEDFRRILRPRTSDLLTRFDTIDGPRWFWSTFSADQIDLNYRNPRVLLRMVQILLDYHRRGADVIRLDAITYLWKELGTSCANLPQAHEAVRFFRAVFDTVAPGVALITETNVPHEENIRYFGDGTDEAQMVYNFALPPLVLFSFLRGDATELTNWARTSLPTSPSTTFFNFLDSHDGVGVLPVRDILGPERIEWMIERVREHGGLVSYRDSGDGTKSPYEINCTWYSALNGDRSDDDPDILVDRFVASRAIALVLAGVPGVYLPSLFGARNDHDAVRAGAGNRAINRKQIDEKRLFLSLMDPNTVAHRIARRFGDLIRKRIQEPAFDPNSTQAVVDAGSAVFAVTRHNERTGDFVLALTNVTPEPHEVRLSHYQVGRRAREWSELVTEEAFVPVEGILDVSLRPYQIVWLKPSREAEG